MSSTALKKRKQSYSSSVFQEVSQIRYTQASIKDTFSNGAPLSWTIYMLKTKQIKPRQLPLIRVGFVDNQWKSIDNRRLFCFKTAGIDKIPVIIKQDITEEFFCKNQSQNDGLTISLVIDSKSNVDHNNTGNQMIIAYDPETSNCRIWEISTIIQQTKELKLTLPYNCNCNKKSNQTEITEIRDTKNQLNDILSKGYTNNIIEYNLDEYMLVISYFDRIIMESTLETKIKQIIIAHILETVMVIKQNLKLRVLNKPFTRIEIEDKITLSADKWDKEDSNKGIIQIFGNVIVNKGIIDASECGYYGNNGPGFGKESYRKDEYCGGGGHSYCGATGKMIRYYGGEGGVSYGNDKLTKLYHGCGCEANYNRGGGIIVIHCQQFINHGQLKCNGDTNCSGGSILIIAKKCEFKKSAKQKQKYIYQYYRRNASIEAIGGSKTERTGSNYKRNLTTFIGSGSSGRIAIYYDECDGDIDADPEPYVGSYNDGLQIINNMINNTNLYVNTL